MDDRLAAIRGRHAIWPAMPDFREEAPNDLEWALTEIARLTAQAEALADALSDVLSGGNPIIDDERARAALADYRAGKK